jgi:toxin ParE1/3/4
VARLRLSLPAQADLARILETSTDRWGADGRRRYAALLAAALRMVAREPESVLSLDRSDLSRGIRSLHLRHARRDISTNSVNSPVHVIYYRVVEAELIEIVRLLHEHMEPSRYVGRRKR